MFRMLWAGLALLLSLTAQAAVQVTDRFAADIIPAQITQTLAQSQRQALEQVLVKLTGSSAALSDPVIEKAVSRAGNYVVQYGYYQAGEQERFRASFNPSQLEILLARSGQPVWGSLRPQLLLWIAQERPVGRRLLSDSDAGNLTREVKTTAEARGLPVLLPLMDLDDSMAVSSADVWGSFIDNLQPASRRYEADFVVVAKAIPQLSQGWRLSWQLWNREMADTGILARGQTDGAEAEVAQQMVNQIADYLGKAYAMRNNDGTQGQQLLIVKGVERMADANHLRQMLRRLPVVASSALIRVEGSQLTFELTLLGAVTEFEQALSLEHRLQVMAAPQAESSPPVDVAATEPVGDGTEAVAGAAPEADIHHLYYLWRSS